MRRRSFAANARPSNPAQADPTALGVVGVVVAAFAAPNPGDHAVPWLGEVSEALVGDAAAGDTNPDRVRGRPLAWANAARRAYICT